MRVLIFFAALAISSFSFADMMEGKITQIKIAPYDQAVEVSIDKSGIRCPVVVLAKSATMFEERYSLLLAAMMANKDVAIWVSDSSCTANSSNPGTSVIN